MAVTENARDRASSETAEGPPAMMSVTEVSGALGIHPTQVRSLIRRGDLAGERVGSQWIVPAAELVRLRRRSAVMGRRFSERIAWSVIASLEGIETTWTLSREERARVRTYADQPPSSLFARLAGRGRVEPLSVGPGALGRLDGGLRWMRGAGARPGGTTVAYLSASDLEAFLEASNAVSDLTQPNLQLRVVTDRWWPFGGYDGGAVAWPTVLELDRFDIDQKSPLGRGE